MTRRHALVAAGSAVVLAATVEPPAALIAER